MTVMKISKNKKVTTDCDDLLSLALRQKSDTWALQVTKALFVPNIFGNGLPLFGYR
jgi:hypothetical protein